MGARSPLLRANSEGGPRFQVGDHVETIPRPARITHVLQLPDGRYLYDIELDPAGGVTFGGMCQRCGEKAIRPVES